MQRHPQNLPAVTFSGWTNVAGQRFALFLFPPVPNASHFLQNLQTINYDADISFSTTAPPSSIYMSAANSHIRATVSGLGLFTNAFPLRIPVDPNADHLTINEASVSASLNLGIFSIPTRRWTCGPSITQ